MCKNIRKCGMNHDHIFDVLYESGQQWLVCSKCIELEHFSRFILEKKTIGPSRPIAKHHPINITERVDTIA